MSSLLTRTGRLVFAKLGVSTFLTITCASDAFAKPQSHGGHDEEMAASHSSGGLPQLDPSSFESQIFWLVVIFTTLYFVFAKKSIPEIAEVIENRKERIRSDLNSAQELKEQVESVQKTYEDNLAQARLDAVNSYKQAEAEVKRNTENEMKAFFEKSSEKISAMEKNIEKAKADAMKDINNIASEIAVAATEKIIGVRVKEAKAA